jgi:branched-chain amino acid aminotransferase
VTESDGGVIWIDGNLVPSAQATVHVLSHGMQRGSTVFDVLKVVPLDDGPAALGLREHVARFMQSMQLMGMTSSATLTELEQAVADVVAANPGADVVKLAAAWVEVPLRSLPVTTVPTVYVAALVPSDTVDPGGAKATVRLKTAAAPKMPASVLPPSLKVAASYTSGVRERLHAVAEGFDDVVFRTADSGDLAEGTTQSLFVVKGGAVLLPPLDAVLDGITRRVVLDLVRHAEIDLEVRPVYWDEVTGADELFLSSTNSQVLPVTQLDGRALVGPGPVTAALAQAMDELLAGSHELSRRWLTPLS